MNHTLLFEEGNWEANGIYQGEDGKDVVAEGYTKITHEEEVWRNETFLRVKSPEWIEYKFIYQIEPGDKGAEFLRWKATNPVTGNLSGKCLVYFDSIFSTYNSEDEKYTGHEFFLKLSDENYLARGALFRDGKLISCWAVELSKLE